MPSVEPKPAGEASEGLVFADVYRTHLAFIWRCLRRLGVREGELDDVCQETFMTAHAKLHTFDGSSAVRTWLFGIALRKASEYRRQPRVKVEQSVAEVPEQISLPSQGQALEQARARQMLDQILDGLDDDKRAVFSLYELEQLPMANVAELLGCPVQTAYSRLHAARDAVQAAVQRLQSKEQRL